MQKYKPVPLSFSETKLVRVADEDDDRSLWTKDEKGRLGKRVYANPLFLELREKITKKGLYVGGWYPAINIRLRTMKHDYVYDESFEGFQGCAGFFKTHLTCRGGIWRVSCWGDDDDWHEKNGMTELQAKRTYDRITDHMPIRSLYNRLGFKYSDKYL